MKKIIVCIFALVSMSAIQAQNWSLDKSHSKLTFTIVHLGISEQEGNFKNFSVKLTSSKEDFSDAVIELTADISSIDTDNATRDEHLRGTNYFDAAAYPALTFKSKSFTKTTGNKYTLTGDITIKMLQSQLICTLRMLVLQSIKKHRNVLLGLKLPAH